MSSKIKITCSTQEELNAAIEGFMSGKGGEILLAPGMSFSLKARDNTSFDNSEITIRSADSNNLATLISVDLKGIENITFEDLYMEMENDSPYALSGMLRLSECNNISFKNNTMIGDAEGAPGTTEGFEVAANTAVVRNSSDITFEGNEISNFNQGLAFLDCEDIFVSRNEITALQGDGIRIGGVSGMEISENYIHDFIGSTSQFNHSDFIQFWGANITVNNEDILIRENILDTGNGPAYQMIFGRNEDQSENGFSFTNIQIENNLLHGASFHAISLQDTQGAMVRNNTVLTNPSAYFIEEDGSQSPSTMLGAINIGGTGAVVEDNIASIIQNPGTNIILDDGSPANDATTHFTNLEAGGDGDLRDLTLRPDSPLNGLVGSSLTWFTPSAETLMAVADVEVSAFDQSLVNLSAELSRGPMGSALEAGASFLWSFSDGSTQSGAQVSHDFLTPGQHDYTLVVTLPDGRRDSTTRSIEINSPHVFDLGFSGSEFTDNTANGAEVALASGAAVQDGWLEIGDRAHLEINRDTEGLYNLNSFNLGITIDRAAGAEGSFLYLHQSFDARLDAEGHVHVTLQTDAGTFTLVSGSAIFADEQPHSLNIIYNGDQSSLALLVDGQVTDTIEASGTTPPLVYWGLNIGHPWGRGLEARVQDVYLLNEDLSRDGGNRHEIAPDAQPSFLGYLFCDREGVEAVDLEYSLSGPGPWTPDGINIRENQLTLSRQNDVFYEAEAFSLSFNLQLSNAEESGSILYLHNTMELSLNASGQLVLRLNTSEGWQQIATAPADWDADVHAISIQYDGQRDSLQLTLDGELAASGSQSGTTAPVQYWGVSFGHPWAGSAIDALVNYINVTDVGTVQDGAANAGQAIDLAAHDLFGEALLAFDFEQEIGVDLSGGGAQLEILDQHLVHSESRGSQVLEVSAESAALSVSRDYDALYGQDDFVFALDLQSETANGRSVFGIHQSLSLDVVEDDLVFRMTTDEGTFTVATDGDVLADRDWHAVEIAYSDSLGLLQLQLDGETLDSTTASGQTADREYWGLTIGNTWGRGFEGQIDDYVFLANPDLQHFDLL